MNDLSYKKRTTMLLTAAVDPDCMHDVVDEILKEERETGDLERLLRDVVSCFVVFLGIADGVYPGIKAEFVRGMAVEAEMG